MIGEVDDLVFKCSLLDDGGYSMGGLGTALVILWRELIGDDIFLYADSDTDTLGSRQDFALDFPFSP